jgi:archaellum component FlaC
MTKEKVITLSEFKTVIEEVNSNTKKIIEVMQHNFSQMDKRFDHVEQDIRILKTDVSVLKADVSVLKTDMHAVKGQVGLLLEGQTEIRSGLKGRVTYQEFEKLDKRVTRLEKKTA